MTRTAGRTPARPEDRHGRQRVPVAEVIHGRDLAAALEAFPGVLKRQCLGDLVQACPPYPSCLPCRQWSPHALPPVMEKALVRRDGQDCPLLHDYVA